MNVTRMTADEEREYADRIHALRLAARLERRARRHRFWTRAHDFVLSIPAGIGLRIGG